MKRSLFLVLLFLLTSFLIYSDKDIQSINNDVDEITAKLKILNKKKGSILNEIYRVELMFAKAKIEVSKVKLRLKRTETKIVEKEKEKNALQEKINRSKKNIKTVLRILYKTGGNVYLRMFVRISSFENLFKNFRLFISLINYKLEEINTIKNNISKLEEVKKVLYVSRASLLELKNVREEKIREIAKLKHGKLDLIKNVNNDRKRYISMLNELRVEAEKMDRFISSKQERSEFEKLELPIIRGKLRWPIRGKVISTFGKKKSTRFNTYIINEGIEIKPDNVSNVKSIYDGEIIYADYYMGYGNMLIVKHALNFISIYGHCETLFKKKGDIVSEGEDIAKVGNSGATSDKSLYLAVWINTKAVNPLKWLVKK